METTNNNFCHILLYYFRKGKNAAQVAKNIRDLYGDNAFKAAQCRYWFMKFRGDFLLKDNMMSMKTISRL